MKPARPARVQTSTQKPTRPARVSQATKPPRPVRKAIPTQREIADEHARRSGIWFWADEPDTRWRYLSQAIYPPHPDYRPGCVVAQGKVTYVRWCSDEGRWRYGTLPWHGEYAMPHHPTLAHLRRHKPSKPVRVRKE